MSKFQEFLGSLRKEALVFPAVAAATAVPSSVLQESKNNNNNNNDEEDNSSSSTDNNHNNKYNNNIAAVVAPKNPRKAIEIAWGSAVMELQSWLLYHLVAVDCNQVMQSAATTSAYQMGPASTIGPSSSTNGSSSSSNATTNGSNGSRARDLGLRAQKKILGKFASSNAGRALFIDDATAFMLDNLYKLMDKAARASSQLDKKQPEKVLKNIVKLSIKIGLLHRNQQLGPSDTANIDAVRRALHSCAMTVLSFYELEFSFDRAYLCRSFERCRQAVHELVRPHLTDKSHERCDQVFDFLGHPDFLDRVFAQDSELRPILGLLVQDLNKALENGQL